MNTDKESRVFDVVIVGAGMVGLTAAIAIKESGLNVAVLDGRDESLLSLADNITQLSQSSYDNRVSALTRASENIFTNLGVWQEIKQLRVSPYCHMNVWDGDGSGRIQFSSAELHEPYLGHIVENRVSLAALLKVAAAIDLPIITSSSVVDLSERVQGYRVLTTEQGDLLSAKLVIGADGAMSKIRQLASMPIWQWDYGHHAIVTTVATEKSHENTAWQRFTDDGPLAFLPLDDDRLSSIVWSTSAAHAKTLMEMTDSDFLAALSRAFENRLGAVIKVESRAVFPLRQRHATQYVKEGLAVIGDAAHTIHPLAGQGVNLGLLDAAELSYRIGHAFERGQDIGSLTVLKKYQRARQGSNIQMSAAMQAFKWLFDEQPMPIVLARNLGMNLLNKAAPIKQHIALEAMGMRGALPPLALP